MINNNSIEKKYQIEKEKKKIEISQEDANNNKKLSISMDQNRELFNEIKLGIKIDL